MKKRLTKMDFWVLAVLLALIAGVFVRSRMTVAMPDTMTFSYQMELSDVEGTIAPGDFTDSMLSDTELANVQFLKAAE